MWLQYISYSIIFLLVFVYLVYSAYIKFTYPFWSRLHMNHSYNILQNFYREGIISTDPIEKSKWTNNINIKIIRYDKITTTLKDEITKFLKANRITNKNVIYKPTNRSIFSYYNAHNSHCFIGIYYEKHHNMQHSEIENNIIGMIMSRPLSVRINNKYFTTYLVENLVIHKDQFKNADTIRPELIHTIIFKQQQLQTYRTCLFMREGQLNIPTRTLISYKTYFFSMDNWNKTKMMSAIYQIVPITSKNIFTLKHTLKNMESKFKCTILPVWSNIHELISNKELIIYTLTTNHNVLALYFFKDSNTIQSKGKTVELIASVNFCENVELFILGLNDALLDRRAIYTNILLHNISHTSTIINAVMMKHKPNDITTSHLFLYNYIQPTLQSSECFVIN